MPRWIDLYGFHSDLHIQACKSLVKSGLIVENVTFRDKLRIDDDYYWLSHDEVVGAILSGDSAPRFCEDASQSAIYDFECNCGRSPVESGVVNFLEAPTKKKLAAIASEFSLFLTSNLADLLGLDSSSMRGTTIDGKPSDLWRLVTLEKKRLIDIGLSCQPISKHFCGEKFRRNYGIWVSKTADKFCHNVAFEQNWLGHIGYERRLLVDLEVAAKLIKRRAVANLSPVYSRDSSIAANQQQVLASLGL